LLAVLEIDRVDEVRGIQSADGASAAGSDDLASVGRSEIRIEQHAWVVQLFFCKNDQAIPW
jgi:hypothetical protein